MQMFQIALNKLFESLFSRVLASHHGGLGLIPSRDMSVLEPPLQDGDDLGQVCAGLWFDIRIYHTMFTWYAHKILFNTVLTVAVSNLHYPTLCLQRQCVI